MTDQLEACKKHHPAGTALVAESSATAAEHDLSCMPVVDAFMHALAEVERCRDVFGVGPVLDPERDRLAAARVALLDAWRRRPAA